MAQTKRCPYCGEEILEVAKKCKYCGEWLDDSHNAASPQQQETTPQELINDSPKNNKRLIYLLAAVVILLIVFFVFSFKRGGGEEYGFTNGSLADSASYAKEYAAEQKELAEIGMGDDAINWDKKWHQNEFGEDDKAQPYLQRHLQGQFINGDRTEGTDESIFITIEPNIGICFHNTGALGSTFGGDPKLYVETSNGKTEIPSDLSNGYLIVHSRSAIQELAYVMQQGNYKLYIIGSGLYDQYWRFIFDIRDETVGLIPAMHHIKNASGFDNTFGFDILNL